MSEQWLREGDLVILNMPPPLAQVQPPTPGQPSSSDPFMQNQSGVEREKLSAARKYKPVLGYVLSARKNPQFSNTAHGQQQYNAHLHDRIGNVAILGQINISCLECYIIYDHHR